MPADKEIERLMNNYGDAILRMCFLYLKDYHLAEDAAQETFMKAMSSYDLFQHKSSEKTWLTKIAINVCKNMIRTNWFQLSRNELKDTFQNPGDAINLMLEQDSLSSAIMKLSMNDRKLILLYYYQELSMREIAEIVGKSENTVIQRVNRARSKLKKILMEAGYEDEKLKRKN